MNALAVKLKTWYSGLQERERRVVTIGAAGLGLLILFGGILLPLQSAVSAAGRRADTRREDLAWMRVNAPEIQSGAATLFSDTGEAPVVVVDRAGREAGLGGALKGTQPSGNGDEHEPRPYRAGGCWRGRRLRRLSAASLRR